MSSTSESSFLPFPCISHTCILLLWGKSLVYLSDLLVYPCTNVALWLLLLYIRSPQLPGSRTGTGPWPVRKRPCSRRWTASGQASDTSLALPPALRLLSLLPSAIPPPNVHGKAVFWETGSWCQEGWGVLLYNLEFLRLYNLSPPNLFSFLKTLYYYRSFTFAYTFYNGIANFH